MQWLSEGGDPRQSSIDTDVATILSELSREDTRLSSWEDQSASGEVNTLYKRVGVKVQPVDDPREPEPMELGREDWKEVAREKQLLISSLRPPDVGPFDHLFEPRYAPFPRGKRLTPERLQSQKFGDALQPTEKELFKEMIFNREAAIAFTFSESGRIQKDVAPPYRIRTIPHKAWQVRTFPVARSQEEELVRMLLERIERSTLERCDSQYRNPWHLVGKKDGRLRFINNAQHMNKVSLRDAGTPPTADEFSERFAGCKIMSLMDFFSGYDQITLHEDSRDMTAVMTPIGLLRSCTLVQGATNSVAVFQRTMMKILKDHWPHTLPFLDDVTCGGPKTDYEGEEALPGVRRYVLEHIQQLDAVLADVERAGGTVSGLKCYWGHDRLGVVGYEVASDGRHPDRKKAAKIADWPECRNPKEVRMFVGICVYYRIWIPSFAIRAKPLFNLMKADAAWVWGDRERLAMQTLKDHITNAPALMTVSHKNPGTIFLSVDASHEGAGACLEQIGPDGKRHPCRFESTLWSKAESNWHSTKLECKAVVWALKKFRMWLYGVHFIIETDAQTLIAQLNRSSSDLPGSVMNRWLAAILLWDFEIRHVPGKKNVVADALSRYPKPEGWEQPDSPESDIEEFIDNLVLTTEVTTSTTAEADRILQAEYSDASEDIAVFLRTLRIPKGMTRKESRAWKKRAMNYFERDGYLFRKTSRNVAIRRVIDDADIRTAAIWEIHRLIGHRGVNAVFSMMAHRYYWENMYREVKARIMTCKDCQLRATKRSVDMLTSTYSHALWETVAVDVVHMPMSRGYRYLVLAREYLSGWVEGRALPNNQSSTVAKFLYEDIICRWSMTRRLMVDGGPDFTKVVKRLATAYNIRRVQASAHNPQAMGKVEGGHKPIVNALAKLSGQWVDNLPSVLLADRISIQSSGYSAYQLVTGQNPVLPIELALPTWQTLPYRRVEDRSQLLAIRAMQLDLRDQFLKDAVGQTERLRAAKKEYWDNTKEVRQHEIRVGDLVLLWDSVRQIDMSRDKKLSKRWLGPYRVSADKTNTERGTYLLEDLDGTRMPHTVPGWRIKKFFERSFEDTASEDRGLLKIWDNERWQRQHEDPSTAGLGARDEADAGNAREPAAVEVRPRQLTEYERAQYERYDDSSNSDTDSD